MRAAELFIKPFQSLKTRMIVILLLNSLLPLMLLGAITYLSIQSIFHLKIEGGIRSALKQTRIGFENVLSNMEYASVQLSSEGSVGQKLYGVMNSQSFFEKMKINQEIENNINLVNFTNPYLGIMFYYFADTKQIKYQNLEAKQDFTIDRYSLFGNFKGASFYGPHPTTYKYGSNIVFSLVRPIQVPGMEQGNVYVYIETNVLLLEQILDRRQFGMEAAYVLLNQNDEVVLSDIPEQFPVGEIRTLKSDAGGKEEVDEYYVFTEKSNQGWSIEVIIKRKHFYKEFREWLLKYGGIASFCLMASLALASLVWRLVYRPLKKIHREIASISENRFSSPVQRIGITEFDRVLHEFHLARDKIVELLGEIEHKERTKAQLEVEKLLYQINPHFIHNTLNTIQWIARMEGQPKIVRLVSIFTRLLSYNLGKNGATVPLANEIDAIHDYIGLQSIRYDYPFDVRFRVDDSLLEVNVPRFILQPLVENALYHGLGDQDGIIEVIIERQSPYMIIQVKDNGAGMTEEEVKRLMDDGLQERNKTGLGIGLNYVYRMIKVQYGESCQFDIESRIGHGTTITLRIGLPS